MKGTNFNWVLILVMYTASAIYCSVLKDWGSSGLEFSEIASAETGNKRQLRQVSPEVANAGKEPSPVCLLPKDVGYCRGHIPRFYFDSSTGKCTSFLYGGCGGNDNVFETIEKCKEVCGGDKGEEEEKKNRPPA